jgi:4-hydroxythreonine-4-phosphate dehydrogenase
VTTRPTIAISLGDPGGIGPEVIVRALTDRAVRASARFAIHGSSAAMHRAADAMKIDPFWWRVDARSSLAGTVATHDVVLFDSDPELSEQGGEPEFEARSTRLGGALSFRWVEAAIADAQRPEGDPRHAHAVVTGPISKEAWSMAGKGRWPGHTELFADRFKSKRFAMMFVGQKLRVVLATVHVPLMDVRNHLTIGAVHTAIDLGHDACTRARRACWATRRSGSSPPRSNWPCGRASTPTARCRATRSSTPRCRAASTWSWRCTTTRG